jgi:hypothetical protein
MTFTLNQLEAILRSFANQNYFVKEYQYGNFLDAISQKDTLYPLVVCDFLNGSFDKVQTDIQIVVTVADRVLNDESNLLEVQSDTLQICRDAYVELSNYKNQFQVTSVNFQRFVEKSGDVLSGYVVTFTLKLLDVACYDGMPLNNKVTILINGNAYTVAASGTIVDIPIEYFSGGTTGTIDGDTVIIPDCENEIDITFDSIPLGTATTSPYNIDCSTTLDVAIITNNATFNGTYTANGTQNGQTKYVNTVNSNLVIIGGAAWQVKNLVGTTINQDPPTGQDYPWLADWGGQLTMVQATIENYCGGGTAPDGEFYINLVKVADVPSGGNASAFVTLDGVNAGTYNSINNTWEVVSNPCSDATYTIKDRDETTLYSGSIVSGGNLNQYIENTTVEVNDTSFADVVAQGYLNVQVLNTEATQLGSKVGNNWEIPDTTYNIYVNGVLDQSFSVPTLKAETINITP